MQFSKSLCLALAFVAGAAAAQTFPDRPIKIIVPFPAGGGTDPFARSVCESFTAQFKQPCIVESKPGAGTAIGNTLVSRSPPDGQTLLLTTSAFSIVPAINKNPGYAGVDAFSPIALIGETTSVVVVKSDSPYKTIQEFLGAARANPGKLNYGFSGVGTTTHLTGELFTSEAKLNLVGIPYRGAGLLINEMLGGQLDIGLSSLTSAMPFLADKRIRALAVTTAKRHPSLPDTPTLHEAGVTNFNVPVWYGLFAPPHTSPAIVQKLNKALTHMPNDTRFVEWANREGVVWALSTPEQLASRTRDEEKRWRALAKEKNIGTE